MKLRNLSVIVLSLSAVLAARAARADDVFYRVPFKELVLTSGAFPTNLDRSAMESRRRGMPDAEAMEAYAVVDGDGEAYFTGLEDFGPWIPPGEMVQRGIIAVRAPKGKEATGRLFVAKADCSGMTVLAFEVPVTAEKPEAKEQFFRTKADHYQRLLDRGLPGAAWFRHLKDEAEKGAGQQNNAVPLNHFNFRRLHPSAADNDEIYGLFSGGRAVSENLQLDRAMLTVATTKGATVDISTLPGIIVKAMDWKPLLADAKPETDPLAACIPADQHAIFFRSFEAMTRMMDEADTNGTPLLQMFEPRSEDMNCKGRYQKQLCLGLSEISRALGPKVVNSVAFTGSDPYLRMGTDLGVVFEAQSADALKTFILARQLAAQSDKEVKAVKGEVDGVAYSGVVSPGRSVSSYVASHDNVVFVCNSLYQLGRLVSAAKGKTPALLSQDEYTFFRNRYSRTDPQETAFLVLSDATIRRWCGAQWRIASARRIRAAAVMAEMQAAHFEELAAGKVQPGPLKSDLLPADAGELSLTKRGVSSSVYGGLDFLTPIAELNLTKVTPAEADSYKRWCESYQRNWSQFFDPIAARFSLSSNQIGVELTVMPLIVRTEYADILRLSDGAAIAPNAGDRHPGALAHLALAINAESDLVKQGANFLHSMSPGLSANALGWIGQSVSLYADEDPFWDQLAKAEATDAFMEHEYHRLPVALHCEVKNALGVTAFLTAVRAFADQSAPGMAVWSTQDYNGQSYVKVTAKSSGEPDGLDNVAVFYAVTPKWLTVTMNEDVLKRALDREAARAKAPNALAGPQPWLGTNLCLQLDGRFLAALQNLFDDAGQNQGQTLSWNNLPVLNEWKRRFPAQDPVKLHEQFWQTRLVCPGGGSYVWNEKWQTMESTVYGHPGEPKKGPSSFGSFLNVTGANLGLSFENKGLSAKAVLRRDKQN